MQAYPIMAAASTISDVPFLSPDIVFLRAEHAARCRERITGPPALIVEVVSNTSRQYDNVTKKADYERCGVAEYWIIDPERQTMTFYRLHEGRYVEVAPEGDRLASAVVTGFVLDLARVRKTFQAI
jgi:Uma2 family endonuclease